MNEKGMPVMKISIEQIKALLYKQKSMVFLGLMREMNKPWKAIWILELQLYLEELFGVKVDLVAEEYIKPSHYESIMEGLVRVYQ